MRSNEETEYTHPGIWAGKGKSGGSSASYSSWKFWDNTAIDQCPAFEKDCATGEGNKQLSKNKILDLIVFFQRELILII